MKRLLVFVLVVLLMGGLGGALAPYVESWANRQISEGQYLRLSKGMTREEVNSALGVLPGDFTNGKGEYRTTIEYEGRTISAWYTPDCGAPINNCWYGYQGMIECFFDEKGHLVRTDFYISEPPPSRTAWKRIEGWLSFGK